MRSRDISRTQIKRAKLASRDAKPKQYREMVEAAGFLKEVVDLTVAGENIVS